MPIKVLLINPPGFGDTAGEGINVGLGCLAAAVQNAGYDVKVLDLNTTLKAPDSQRIDSCLSWLPDMVGLSINSFNVLSAIKIGGLFKARLPNASFWAGGPHITITKSDFLKEYFNIFDGLVIGEGDITIVELLAALSKAEFDTLNAIPGLVIKTKNGDIHATPLRELIKDLDTLPFPNYEVFDSFPQVITHYNMLTSRGCPYDCVFCASKEIWRRKWNHRSLENIEKEISEVKKKYNVRRVNIVDDNFSLKKGRAIDILNLLARHGFEIALTGGIRADAVDEELAKTLKKYNVSPVVVGVENGDPDTFEYVSKGETLEEIEHSLKILRENDIFVIATMVIGLINTTTESTTRSIKFLRKLGVRGHWQIAVPIPGTNLYKWAHEHGRIIYDYSLFAKEGFRLSTISYPPPVCFDTLDYPAEKRLEDFQRANLMTWNYNFLYTESEPLHQIIARLTKLIIKYDANKIGIHTLKMAKVLGVLIRLKWKRKKMGRF